MRRRSHPSLSAYSPYCGHCGSITDYQTVEGGWVKEVCCQVSVIVGVCPLLAYDLVINSAAVGRLASSLPNIIDTISSGAASLLRFFKRSSGHETTKPTPVRNKANCHCCNHV